MSDRKFHSVFIIDDAIPAEQVDGIDDADVLNQRDLETLKNRAPWREQPLKDLVLELLTLEGCRTSGAKNPKFFLEALRRGAFAPDILVLDWDIPAAGNMRDLLLGLLKNYFILIFVYTGADKEAEVRAILDAQDCRRFASRVAIIRKESPNSAKTLIGEAEKAYAEKFSFRFGRELREAGARSLESILVTLGEHKFSEIATLLKGSGEGAETEFKQLIAEKIHVTLAADQDLRRVLIEGGLEEEGVAKFLALIADRARDHVAATEVSPFPMAGEGQPAEAVARELWSYRLYFNPPPSDQAVRCGDIFKDDSGGVFLVVSGDCDLNKFWDKTFGVLNVIPLHELRDKRDWIRAKVQSGKALSKIQQSGGVHSIAAGLQGLPGAVLFPFVKANEDFHYYLGFGKEITSKSIARPEAQLRTSPLKYGTWQTTRLCTVTQSFLIPSLRVLMEDLSSTGAPDYSKVVSDMLAQCFETLRQ